MPVKFVYQLEFIGKRPLITRVERTIKDVAIGNIDKTMFDTTQIPEFAQDFEDTLNYQTKTYSSQELPKTPLSHKVFRIFCMTLGIVLIGLIIYKSVRNSKRKFPGVFNDT